MKKITVLFSILSTLLLTHIGFSQNSNGTIDAAGDIAIVAMNRVTSPVSKSDFAFVLLDDCTAGTAIIFDDDEWEGSGWDSTTGEGAVTWTNTTGGTLAAGTVIQVASGNDSPTVNLGTAVESDGGFNLSDDDQLYAYIGTFRGSSVTFLTFRGDDSVTTNATLSGTGLTDGVNATMTTNPLGYYSGSTVCNGTRLNCGTDINTTSNWTNGSFTWPTGVATAFTGTAFSSCSAPTGQASSPSFGSETSSTLNLTSFTAPGGGADGYVIKMNSSNSFSAPSDSGSLPSASLAYGGGEQVVYAGSSASPNITVTGLSASTTYYFQVYAYNDCSGTYTYETTGLNASDDTAAPPNNAPTDISLSPSSINESSTATNATVGTLSTTDADGGDSHTYSLVSGTGDTDNGSFNISGSTLRTSSSLAAGSYSVRVNTNDGTDDFAKAITVTVVDNVAPSPPSTPDLDASSDTGSSSTDNYTSDNTPTFSGTAEANVTVNVSSNVDGSLGSTTADGSGNWSITASTLSPGAHTIAATATDAASNTSTASSGLAITIDTLAPGAPSTPDLDASSDTGSSNSDDITADNTPTLTGTSEANATVTLISSVNGSVGTATADGSGNWSITASTLSEGAHTMTATATDAAGNLSSASSGLSITIDTTAPTFNSAGTTPAHLATGVALDSDLALDFSENIVVGTGDIAFSNTGGAVESFTVTTESDGATMTPGAGRIGILNDKLYINPTANMAPGTSHTFALPGGIVTDVAGNANPFVFSFNHSFTTLVDTTPPSISSVSLASDNSYIDVTFTEGVFNTNGGSGALETTDFSLSLTGGAATSPTVTSVTTTGGVALSGGETTIRVNFSYTGTADAGETLEVDLTDGASVYDASGNAAAANQTSNNTATLNADPLPAAKVYWTTGSAIRSVNVDGSGYREILTGTYYTIAIDDTGQKMYFGGTTGIFRANLDGSNLETLATGLDSRGVALDLTNNKLYWSNTTGDKIERSNLDGTSREDVITGISTPYGIDIDNTNNKIYWMNRGSQHIMRANLDGTSQETVIGPIGTTAQDIVFDEENDRFYWSNLSGLFRTNANGTGGIQIAGLPGQGIALDNPGDRVYGGGGQIQRKDLANTTVEAVLTSGVGGAISLALTTIDVNFSPSFNSTASANFAENTVNTTVVLDVNADDGDGGGNDANVTYSITGGADASLFTIDSDDGELRFNASPDFESPGDANTDNAYVIEVTANDGQTSNNTSTQEITITVTDVNDNSPVFSTSTTQSIAENTTAVVTLASTDADAGASVSYSIVGGADQGLFSLVGADLSFASAPDFESPGDADTNNEYVVQVRADDGDNTTDLTVTVSVTNVNSNVTVEDIAVNEDDGSATFTLTLDSAVTGGFTLSADTSDGTATVGDSDYLPVSSESVVFAGSASETQTVTVTITGDTKVELNETLTIAMSGVVSGTVPANDITVTDTATLTINNDDSAAVTVADISEQENGTFTLTLTADNAVDGGFTVDVNTADNTATAGDDYTALTSEPVSFSGNAGEMKTVTLTVVDDAIVEADETIDISLSNVVAVTVNAGDISITDTATVTIENDDSASVTIADVSGNEDAGAITVTLLLDNPVDGGFTLEVNTADGTATLANSDYTAVTSQSIVFAGNAGETKTFDLTPTADVTAETNETVDVSMTSLSPVTVSSSAIDITDNGTVTILNDDDVLISIDDPSVAEGDSGSATLSFTVSLGQASPGTVTVNYASSDGTATAGTDYTAASGTLTFNPGETSKTIDITISGDQILEANETLTMTLSGATGAAIIADATGTGTITNDDAATVTIADVSSNEDDGNITVTATLNNAVQGGFTVEVNTADNTATSSNDYTAVTSEILTFTGNAGETQTFTITPTSDNILEPDEILDVSMSNLGATSLTVDISDTATITISNDDNASVTIEDVSGNEDDGAITLTATLDNTVQNPFDLVINSADGTATLANSDYNQISGLVLNFSGTAGETKTFDLTPIADTNSEPNETLTINMGLIVRNGDGLPDVSDTATVTLINDDNPIVTSVSVPSNDTYRIGQQLDFVVNFSSNVTITGTPRIPLTIGSTSVFASLNGTVSDSNTANFRYTVTAGDFDDDGISVGAAIDLNGATIIDGNSNPAILDLNSVGSTTAINVDGVVPAIVVSTSAVSPTASSFTVNVTLSEPVVGFDLTDLSVTNGAATTFNQLSSTTFSMNIDPAADGDVVVSIAAGAMQDFAGNDNAESNAVTITYDATNPTLVISSTVPDPTNAAFDITVTFSEPIPDFAADDFDLVNANVSNFAGAGTVYTATITPIADGLVSVILEDEAVSDLAGNGNEEATFSVTYDATRPTVAISSAVPNPTNAAFDVTITFSEDVTGFVMADLNVTNGAASNFAGSGSVYTATITPTTDGQVTVLVPENSAEDAATNGNEISNAFAVTYDITRPTVAISSVSAGATNATFDISISFSEDVTGFEMSDLNVGNGTASNFAGTGAVYSATITPAAEGIVTVDVAADVAVDAATNGNTAAAQFDIEYDITQPDVTIASGAADPINGAFDITITFTEDVTGFAMSDLNVGNGTASNFAGSGAVYTATVTPTIDGTVTVDIAANSALDAAGNGNTAASQFAIEYDGTNPTVVISSSAPNPTNTVFDVTISFSEDVTGFEMTDLTLGNATASGFTGSGAVYTATITPVADGLVTVDVAADVAIDAATNGNTTATQFAINYDGTRPTVVVSSSVANPTNAAFDVSITFSEDVTGFVMADLDVTNGTASNFAGSGAVYTATITPLADGSVTVLVPENVSEDVAANGNEVSNEFQTAYDATKPTATLSSTAVPPINAPFTLDIAWSEDVFGFEMADLVVTNGVPSGFSGSGTSYSVLISPSGAGPVFVDVPAGVTEDLATNENEAAAFEIEYDNIPPEPPTLTHISEYTCSGNATMTSDNTLEVSGTAERESVVEMFIDGVSIGTVVTDANTGFFTFDYTGTTLADGTYTFTAQATDIAGNTGALSAGLTITIDTVDTDGDGIADFCDDDDDGSGVEDTSEDCDGDGIVDAQDSDNSTCREPILETRKYGFSPNGDGVNDGWVIENILAFPNNTVSVYSRSGKLVFRQKGYKNDWQAVSNQVGGNTGSRLPVGPYIFLIDLGDGSAPTRGWIYINY